MPLWPILGVSLFAFAMAMFFAVSGVFSPEAGRAAVPASACWAGWSLAC